MIANHSYNLFEPSHSRVRAETFKWRLISSSIMTNRQCVLSLTYDYTAGENAEYGNIAYYNYIWLQLCYRIKQAISK